MSTLFILLTSSSSALRGVGRDRLDEDEGVVLDVLAAVVLDFVGTLLVAMTGGQEDEGLNDELLPESEDQSRESRRVNNRPFATSLILGRYHSAESKLSFSLFSDF